MCCKKGLSFISNRQRRNDGTFGASALAVIEPTTPAPEEQDMPAFCYLGEGGANNVNCKDRTTVKRIVVLINLYVINSTFVKWKFNADLMVLSFAVRNTKRLVQRMNKS